MALSAVYTGLLFAGAHFLRKGGPGGKAKGQPGVTTAADLIFALAVIALGITGSFVPANVFSCSSGSGSFGEQDLQWSTDTTRLSAPVRDWWTQGFSQPASVVVLERGTLFAGRSADSANSAERLWLAAGESCGAQPLAIAAQYSSPRELSLVASSTVCLVARLDGVEKLVWINGENLGEVAAHDGRELHDVPSPMSPMSM